MKIEKLNDLTYLLLFDNNIQSLDYEKIMNTLRDIAE